MMSGILTEMKNKKNKAEEKSADDFFREKYDVEGEARKIASEAVTHVLLWLSSGRSPVDAGLRVKILLYEIRPDLLSHYTLEEIGVSAGVTKQYVHKLLADFRKEFGTR